VPSRSTHDAHSPHAALHGITTKDGSDSLKVVRKNPQETTRGSFPYHPMTLHPRHRLNSPASNLCPRRRSSSSVPSSMPSSRHTAPLAVPSVMQILHSHGTHIKPRQRKCQMIERGTAWVSCEGQKSCHQDISSYLRTHRGTSMAACGSILKCSMLRISCTWPCGCICTCTQFVRPLRVSAQNLSFRMFDSGGQTLFMIWVIVYLHESAHVGEGGEERPAVLIRGQPRDDGVVRPESHHTNS
jgi:hypothetical protein